METIWITIGFLVGVVISAVIVWLWLDRNHRAQSAELVTKMAVAQASLQQLNDNSQSGLKMIESLRSELSILQTDRASLLARVDAEKQNVQEQRNLLQNTNARLLEVSAELSILKTDRATLLARVDAEKQNVIEQRDLLHQADVRLREAFAELSQTSLQKSNEQFLQLAQQSFEKLSTQADGSLEQRKTEIAALIAPMRQTLETYQQVLSKLETDRQTAFTSISNELTKVTNTQHLLSKETSQLVGALRRPKGRGRWGEITLRRLLEMAGLAEKVTFREQVSVDGDEGRQQPDCIIDLPENRKIIVDAKAVFDAFLDSSEATDEAIRQQFMNKHAAQVRSRVTELSRKSYWDQFDDTLEFVVMFLPGEAFLHAAVECDPTLIEDALAQKIIVASPTTLLGLLRVVEASWRQNAVEKNAMEIRDLATELYERIAIMAESFDSLGGSLKKSVDAYNKTLKSLESRVITQAKRMVDLGVQSTREMKELKEVDDNISARGDKWKSLPQPDDGFA